MRNPIHIVMLLALVVFYFGPAVLAGRIADRKGRSFGVYLVASLLIGWPVPLLIVLVLPNRAVRRLA